MKQGLFQGASEQGSPVIGHPGTERAKGDPWIIAQLETALWRNRNGDNPNLKRGRLYFDFGAGRVRIAEARA